MWNPWLVEVSKISVLFDLLQKLAFYHKFKIKCCINFHVFSICGGVRFQGRCGWHLVAPWCYWGTIHWYIFFVYVPILMQLLLLMLMIIMMELLMLLLPFLRIAKIETQQYSAVLEARHLLAKAFYIEYCST